MSMKKLREGFTLVELAFSMVFIGVLSISVVLIISNTVSAYHRGITLSRVNNVGTDLSNEMRSSVQNSYVRSFTSLCQDAVFKDSYNSNTYNALPNVEAQKCINDNAYKYTYVVKKENVSIGGQTKNNVPIYGAFCTGSDSYIWNSGYFTSDNVTFASKTSKTWAKLAYLDKNDGKTKLYYNNGDYFRLIKVQDPKHAVCIAMVDKTGSKYEGLSNEADISVIENGTLKSDVSNLLPNDGGNELVLYDLFVARPAVSISNDNVFYSVSFILGTIGGGIDIMANGNSCAAPESYASDTYNYCAINKFNFAIQVNGG